MNKKFRTITHYFPTNRIRSFVQKNKPIIQKSIQDATDLSRTPRSIRLLQRPPPSQLTYTANPNLTKARDPYPRNGYRLEFLFTIAPI